MPLNYSFSCRVRDERKLKLKFSSEKEQALIFQREDAQKKHPRLADGSRKKFNVYAKTREECEENLAKMIAEKKAEIAAEKKKMKTV